MILFWRKRQDEGAGKYSYKFKSDSLRRVGLKLDSCGAYDFDEQITGNGNSRPISNGGYLGSGYAGSLQNLIQGQVGFLDRPDRERRKLRLVFHQSDIAGRETEDPS